MLTKEEARVAFTAKLKTSALNDADKMGCAVYTAAEVPIKLPGLTTHPAAGFTLPYYSITGKATGFYRFRYLEQPAQNGFAALTVKKPMRYIQPSGMTPQVYFPRSVDWKNFFTKPAAERWLLLTEGELKAACATKQGFPTLGLGGVWSFMSKREGLPLLKDLAALDLKDSIVYIVYDSDAASNPDVLKAENVLARQLLYTMKARPFVIRLPAIKGVAKTGLDDFLSAKGVKALEKLIEKAEEWEQSEALHQLNEEVLFLRANNNVLEPETRNRWRPADFAHGVYATLTHTTTESNKKGEVKMKTMRTAEEWIKWPGRAQVECVTYRPAEPLIIDGQYNMWKGWGISEELVKPGGTQPWDRLMDYVFSGEDAVHRKWFEQWCSFPLQHPGTKMITAPVFWSTDQGTGKTLIAHTLARFYGDNFSEIDASMLNSPHNEWAQYKQFVLGDEITGEELGGSRRVTIDTLKGLTTRQKLYLNPKYIGGYFIPDVINYFFTSNHPDAFRLEDSDRRFAIFEIKGVPLPEEFYNPYYDNWYKSDKIGALFYKFLHLDLTGFNPYKEAPLTRAKKEMISDARSDLGTWVAQLASAPTEEIKKRTLWTTTELHGVYRQGGSERVTVNGLARELKRQRFKKVLNGDPVMTHIGAQKLWLVGGDAKLINNAKAMARLYNEERATDKVFQEILEKRKALGKEINP